MKINEPSRIGNINPYKKNVGNISSVSDVKKYSKDQLVISPEAKEMLDRAQGSARIAELKQAVSSGTYRVDAGKIAEKLLRYWE